VLPESITRALRLGLVQAVSLWRATVLMFLSQAIAVLARIAGTVAVIAWMQGGEEIGLVAICGCGVAALGARLIEVLISGGAVKAGAARLLEKERARAEAAHASRRLASDRARAWAEGGIAPIAPRSGAPVDPEALPFAAGAWLGATRAEGSGSGPGAGSLAGPVAGTEHGLGGRGLGGRVATAGIAAASISSSGRSLALWLWSLPIALISSAWRWLALIAAVWAYSVAFSGQGSGVLASFELALVLTLSAPFLIFTVAWLEASFVRSVHRDQPALTSLHDGAGDVARAPAATLGVVYLCGLLGFLAELLFAGALSSAAPGDVPPESALGLSFAQQTAGGVLAAFALALLSHSRLQAFVALHLEAQGELSPPAPAPPREVLDALPVGPVISALPVERS
jgi:hypothetical protein